MTDDISPNQEAEIDPDIDPDEEFAHLQHAWRRRYLNRVVGLLVVVAAVVVAADQLGVNPAYLYAHRENFASILLDEMLAPGELWNQLRGDGPMLVLAAVETLAIAGVGTAFGLPLAFLFGLLAAGNVTPRWVNEPTRLLLGGVRAVPSMVYALLFVVLAGLGPVAGVLAITVGTIGDLGRLFADEMEEIDPRPVEAVQSAGAATLTATSAARLPQVSTAYIAWTLFYLELNARKSTVLGIVGAGGIGYPLIMAFRARNYSRVMAAIVAILCLVVAVEFTATRLRDYVDTTRRTWRE